MRWESSEGRLPDPCQGKWISLAEGSTLPGRMCWEWGWACVLPLNTEQMFKDSLSEEVSVVSMPRVCVPQAPPMLPPSPAQRKPQAPPMLRPSPAQRKAQAPPVLPVSPGPEEASGPSRAASVPCPEEGCPVSDAEASLGPFPGPGRT